MAHARCFTLGFALALAACASAEEHIEHQETYGLIAPPPPEFSDTARRGFEAATGVGAGHNPARARELLQKACDERDAFACDHMSIVGDLPDNALSNTAISDVISAHRGKMRACYESMLHARTAVAGRVETAFAFDHHGHVLAYRTEKSDLPESLNVCLEGVVRRMIFEPRDAPRLLIVRYPFVFSNRFP